MKKVYAYIRVSTVKQGEGASLEAQKEAITYYAERHALDIIEWIEEKETAAKQGRPLFSSMIKRLRRGQADGVIIHKIDRSARNLRDWADLGDLIDEGVDIHFANESLDLKARGGRLSADIQAIIASDYIRNLREEAIKGLYGRLKQGLFPFFAPIGYLNTGKGNVKAVDPLKAPLVKRAFELYATNTYNLHRLTQEMYAFGLRNGKGGKIDKNGWSKILNNPFYIGIMEVKGTKYEGKHKPLITSALYMRVQDILSGKLNLRSKRHEFRFRRLVKCGHCAYSLIGELQKGSVYYRCHTKGCPTKSLRESFIESMVLKSFRAIELYPEEHTSLLDMLTDAERDWFTRKSEVAASVTLSMQQVKSRMDRLTDAYLDNALDRDNFEERKGKLLHEMQELKGREEEINRGDSKLFNRVRNFLELAKSPVNAYHSAKPPEKRKVVEFITSNLATQGKNLLISMYSPFSELANRQNWLNVHLNGTSLEKSTPNFTYSQENTSPIPRRILSEPELHNYLKFLLSNSSDFPCIGDSVPGNGLKDAA